MQIQESAQGEYTICDHAFDIVVVGAGGAGLRAALGCAHEDLEVACVTKVFPTRSHTVAAQGGMAATLGNMDADDWRFHMYDTVKASDWLGDQDCIEYFCREAPHAIYELEHLGMPFSRKEDGTIYQRAFGGMTTHYGAAPAQRTCAAADRTGHALLHTLYGQALRHAVKFFVEFFVLDLIMNEEGCCCGILAWELATGALHRFRSKVVILATGGCGRIYASCTSAHTCTGDGNAMVLRAHLPLQDMEFVQFHPTGLYGTGCLVTEGARGEGGYLVNGMEERFMERYAPAAKDLAPRDIVARAMMAEIRQGRGAGPLKDHILLHLDHIDPALLQERLPGIMETARTFLDVDITQEPLPIVPTAHYCMGGVPTTLYGESVCAKKRGTEDIVQGLMAIGEGACVSIHGANRLGSNSLTDLIVFGRAAAVKACEKARAMARIPELPKAACDSLMLRFHALRSTSGDDSCAALRRALQETMQEGAGILRTASTLEASAQNIRAVFRDLPHIGVKDHTLIWNLECVEILELHNLVIQALATVVSALNRRESRGAHAREDYPERDDKNWMKHTLSWVHPETGDVDIRYRSVHTYTHTHDIDYIPPKERSY